MWKPSLGTALSRRFVLHPITTAHEHNYSFAKTNGHITFFLHLCWILWYSSYGIQQNLLVQYCQVRLISVRREEKQRVSRECVSRAAERRAKRPLSTTAPCILWLQRREPGSSTGWCGRDQQSRKHSATFEMKARNSSICVGRRLGHAFGWWSRRDEAMAQERRESMTLTTKPNHGEGRGPHAGLCLRRRSLAWSYACSLQSIFYYARTLT